MLELQITKTTFKKVEAEWFHYNNTLHEIKTLEDAILHPYDEEQCDPTIVAGENSVRIPGNPTERTATRLTTHKRLSYLREITSAIETVYNELNEDYKNLVNARYWSQRKKTWDIIADECSVTKRTAQRWRNEIILSTVEVLGWR